VRQLWKQRIQQHRTGGSVTNPGGSALVYLKAGASANSDYSGSVIFVKDPLASVTANGGSNVVLTCPSVSFDYANYPCGNGCIGTGLSFLSQPSGQWVCAGSSASFSASAASSGAIYEWQVDTANFGNFTIILNDSTYSGATTSTLTVTKASASMNGYYYRCILRDSACTASLTNTSDSAKLTVNNCISGITSGAQNSDMIQVYPNPAASQLQVTSSTVQVQTMSVTNMLGVKVIDKSSYVSTLDISGLESGIYFLSVTDQSGNMYQNKFIKQ